MEQIEIIKTDYTKLPVTSQKTYYRGQGGGEGTYSSRDLTGETLESILDQAEKGVADGSLDSGMGYEYLKGCVLWIDELTDIVINDQVFCNVETSVHVVGNLSEDEFEFAFNTRF